MLKTEIGFDNKNWGLLKTELRLALNRTGISFKQNCDLIKTELGLAKNRFVIFYKKQKWDFLKYAKMSSKQNWYLLKSELRLAKNRTEISMNMKSV